MTRDEKIAQAREWYANRWDISAIADELDVVCSTVRCWIDEDFRRASAARVANWRRGPGKEKHKLIVQRYRAKQRAAK